MTRDESQHPSGSLILDSLPSYSIPWPEKRCAMTWIPLESLSPYLGLVQVEPASGWRLGACPDSLAWSVSQAEPACYWGVIVLVIWQHSANMSHQGWVKNRSCAVGPRKISSLAQRRMANQEEPIPLPSQGHNGQREKVWLIFPHASFFPTLLLFPTHIGARAFLSTSLSSTSDKLTCGEVLAIQERTVV